MDESQELAALNAEADMPIEELLAMYKSRQSEADDEDAWDSDSGMEDTHPAAGDTAGLHLLSCLLSCTADSGRQRWIPME